MSITNESLLALEQELTFSSFSRADALRLGELINEESARYQSSKDRVDERRAFYVNHYYNSPTNSDHGTCFVLVNAYYDYMSHDVPVRKTEDEYKDARLSKIVGGKMVSPKLMNFMCQSK